MGTSERPDPAARLRLVDSLLAAAGDSSSALQRLLTETALVVQEARREVAASRDEEVQALRREVEQLREGLASRAVIERAKGMLMQAHDLTESQSFELLTQLSHSRHRKLRDVAADVVDGSLDLPRPRWCGRRPRGRRLRRRRRGRWTRRDRTWCRPRVRHRRRSSLPGASGRCPVRRR